MERRALSIASSLLDERERNSAFLHHGRQSFNHDQQVTRADNMNSTHKNSNQGSVAFFTSSRRSFNDVFTGTGGWCRLSGSI